jgi:hypothetical protein
MDWECGELHTDVTQARVCQWLIPPSEIRDRYTDPTLMSTMVWLALFVPPQANNNGVAAFGIIVVTAFDDADPVGAACPGPVTDCDADWVYLNYAPGLNGQNVVASNGTDLDRRS